jgi:hypothetical protein
MLHWLIRKPCSWFPLRQSRSRRASFLSPLPFSSSHTSKRRFSVILSSPRHRKTVCRIGNMSYNSPIAKRGSISRIGNMSYNSPITKAKEEKHLSHQEHRSQLSHIIKQILTRGCTEDFCMEVPTGNGRNKSGFYQWRNELPNM